MDVIKAQGKNRKKTGSADVALSYIGRLYDIERDAAKRELSPERVYQVRQERAKPILEEIQGVAAQEVNPDPSQGALGQGSPVYPEAVGPPYRLPGGWPSFAG